MSAALHTLNDTLNYTIVDLDRHNDAMLQSAAETLYQAFKDGWGWNESAEEAMGDVLDCLKEGMICRAALTPDEQVIGWIGAQLPWWDLESTMWELHPMAVHPDLQGCGIGRALIRDLEPLVYARGGRTLWLGTDDPDGRTSLYGVDLYEDTLGKLANIQNLRHHPYEFYQKMGYTITGVYPDAGGYGQPDILMAKRLTGATP